MTTLITGGTGKTGSRLARLLDAAGYPILVASRSTSQRSQFNSVFLDWFDPNTFENPFNANPNIERIYLVVPVVLNSLPIFKPFIDLAIEKGVKRFVLLTSVHCDPGTPGLGEVHQYLIDSGADYAILRPSWFTDNLATSFFSSVQEKNVIRSAAGNGRIPWVSSEDIAQAAFDALTVTRGPNRDYYVLGPELYTYEELAKAFSSELGRDIIYRHITVQEQEKIYIDDGVPKDYSHMLAVLTGMVGEGKEESFFHEPAESKFIGKHTVKQFIRENRTFWLKK